MHKRYLIAIVAVALLSVAYSSAQAAPYPDADIAISRRYWQWESPWGENEKYLYAGVMTTDSSG